MESASDRSVPLVLVADDERDILLLIEMVLEEEGYEVECVNDGAKALRKAHEIRPDLCVFDVMMPEVDGYDLTRVLKHDEVLGRIPVILLTARTEPENVARGRESGADEYLSKPFLPEELQTTVRSLLSEFAANGRPAHTDVPEEPEPEPAIELDLEPEPAPQEAGAVILLAGRDETTLNVARYRLELAGYEVAVAESAEQGLELAAQLVPDAFVLDASMPNVNPDAVARLLAGRENTSTIRFMTLANGGPFDPQDLFLRLEAALAA
jgi:DNA-binding response OmpR family regulator